MILNKVEICGVNTSRLPLLTAEEKNTLFERIKKGDKEARELYIKGNLRLVLSVIKRFSSSSENADDLFQIGCIGLMKAIDNFDCTLDVKFSTYAVPMIVGEIRRYLRDNNSIRVSRSLRDIAYKAIYARESLSRETAQEPTLHRDLGSHSAFRKKTSSTHWTPSRARSAFTIRSTQKAVIPSMSWIRSVTRKTRKTTGSENLSSLRSHEASDSAGTAALSELRFFEGTYSDGSGRRNPYLPGTGQPS